MFSGCMGVFRLHGGFQAAWGFSGCMGVFRLHGGFQAAWGFSGLVFSGSAANS